METFFRMKEWFEDYIMNYIQFIDPSKFNRHILDDYLLHSEPFDYL